MKNTMMTKALSQLKREIIEYKFSMIYMPLFLSGLFIIFSTGFAYYWLFVRGEVLNHEITLNGFAIDFMYANCAMMMFIYFYILVNYLSSCLYDDRKSKQILFWRSMPVSETMNVLVKVLVVMVVAPTILLLINELVSLLIIVIGYFYLNNLGAEIIIFPALNEGHALAIPLEIYTDNLIGMVFVLPFIGYFLLISAWAKRFPIAIAFGVPMLLAFIDFMLWKVDLTIGVISLVRSYGVVWHDISSTFVLRSVFEFKMQFIQPLMISILIGVMLIAASIWLRNNRYEI